MSPSIRFSRIAALGQKRADVGINIQARLQCWDTEKRTVTTGSLGSSSGIKNRYNTTMASLAGIHVLIQLVLAVPFIIILWGVSRLVRSLSPWLRATAFLLTATLLLTPGWAPATITVVPIPFGALLGVAVFTFRWDELTDVVQLAPPSWYWFAFPATAVLVYAFRRLMIRNIADWTEPESGRS